MLLFKRSIKSSSYGLLILLLTSDLHVKNGIVKLAHPYSIYLAHTKHILRKSAGKHVKNPVFGRFDKSQSE